MINRELDFISRARDEARILDLYKKVVHTGLEPDGAAFLENPEEIEKLALDISKITIEVCKELKIETPQVGLIHGWNELLPGYDENPSIREVVASAYLDSEDYPAGLISYSPFYIKSELSFRAGTEQNPPAPLEYVIAHEAFHIWQYHNNYERVLQDLRASDGGRDLEAWFITITEQNAIEQGKSWLHNHKVSTRK